MLVYLNSKIKTFTHVQTVCTRLYFHPIARACETRLGGEVMDIELNDTNLFIYIIVIVIHYLYVSRYFRCKQQ